MFDSGTDAARKAAGKSVPDLLLMKKKFFSDFRFSVLSQTHCFCLDMVVLLLVFCIASYAAFHPVQSIPFEV